MSATQQVELSSISAEIDNPDDWEALAHQISVGTGMPVNISPDLIVGMLGSAVPLLFAADAAANPNLLRGTFADQVVAQFAMNAGQFMSAAPTSAAVHLAASRVDAGHPVIRVHLTIETKRPDGQAGQTRQFWDLQVGGQVTVGQSTCPTCGAPISGGALVCDHCHTDVRSVVDSPIVVSRLDLY